MSDRSTTSGVAPMSRAQLPEPVGVAVDRDHVRAVLGEPVAIARPMPLAAPVTRAVRPSIGVLG